MKSKDKTTNIGMPKPFFKGQIPDINNRIVFKNHILCAQFLRDYTDIEILKNVRPEDIEDVTEKYQAYLGISFETDTVKRIHIKEFNENIPMYLISLIEHKSDVDYNVSMQQLLHEDAMSLLMMINKVQNPKALSELIGANHEKINAIIQKAPESILEIIMSTMWNLCMKINVPTREAEHCVNMIGGRQMGNWFENMEKMDIQAERRNTKEAMEKLAQTENKLAYTIITMTKEFAGTKEQAIAKLISDCGKTKTEAIELTEKFW